MISRCPALPALVALALLGFSVPTANCQTGHGSFSGNPVVEFLPDGRSVKLREAFSYVDPDGNAWPVPIGYVANGASIPRGLWTPVGGPFEGPYRDASIFHDYYCEHFDTYWAEDYKRDWKAVHRAFYEGMLARGVGAKKAKLMYGAVYYCGPRWEWNGRLVQRVTRWCPVGGDVNAEDILYDFIESGDRSLEDIERLEQTNARFRQLMTVQPMAPQQARPPQ